MFLKFKLHMQRHFFVSAGL